MSVDSGAAEQTGDIHRSPTINVHSLMRLAAKLLAAVEVSSSASHQHEFNAGQLRVALGLPKDRTSGQLEIIYAGADAEDPAAESCGYTLYDSREGKPRSAEYRLYFNSTELQSNATPGDILIVVRPGDGVDLKALILPQNSATGTAVASMCGFRHNRPPVPVQFGHAFRSNAASASGPFRPATSRVMESVC